MKQIVVIAIALLCFAGIASAENSSFQMTYSSSYAPGQHGYTHAGGYDWTFNSSWLTTTAFITASPQFASWSFASQYFNKGSYTSSRSGTINFYNRTSRAPAYLKGTGTLTYTYLGSANYGAVELVMTTPFHDLFVTDTTLYTTVSDSTLADIGSDTVTGYGYETSNTWVAPINSAEGPVTGPSFGYNYWVFSGNWRVDYAYTNGVINTWNTTPQASQYRYWVEGADGTLITPMSAFTSTAASGYTIQRARVYVQDPFFNETDMYFWIGQMPTFNLTASPKNITTSQSTSAIIRSSTGSFAEIGALTIGCAPQACYYNGRDPTFLYTGGVWKQWNDATNAYDITYGAAFPGSLPLTFAGAGHITLYADLIPKALGEDAIRVIDSVDVTGQQGSATLQISTKNCVNNGLVSGASIDLLDVNTGTWTNRTSSTGRETFPIQVNMPYGWTATRSGYPNTEVLYNKFNTNSSVDVLLCANATLTTPTNASTRVWVVGSDTLKGIEGISVRFGSNQVKTTPASGMVEFESLPSTTYEIQTGGAGDKGYEDTVTTYSTGASGSTTSGVTLELQRIYQSTPTPSVTDPNTGQPITPQTTADTRTDAQKDADLAGQVRDSAPDIVSLFILAIIVGTVGLMGKAFK